MNPESVEYDEGSEEITIIFTDDNANERLTLILFSNEAKQLWKMLQEKLKYKKETCMPKRVRKWK